MNSACSRKYYLSLLDPFTRNGACIPTFPSLPSGRFSSFARGTFYTNTVGNGFIAVNPFSLKNATPWTGHRQWDPIMYTDGSGALTQWTTTGIDDSIPIGAVTATANSAYSAPYGPSGIRCRLVSAGVRVEYAGALSNLGGTYYSQSTTGNNNIFTLNGAANPAPVLSSASIGSNAQTSVTPITTTPLQILYTPGFVEAMDYYHLCETPLSSGAGQFLGSVDSKLMSTEYPLCLGAVIQSAAASQPFRYDIVANWEVTGDIRLSLEPGESDVQGTASAVNRVANAVNSMGQRIVNGAIDALPRLGNTLAERTLNSFQDAAVGYMSDPALLSASMAAVGGFAARRSIQQAYRG